MQNPSVRSQIEAKQELETELELARNRIAQLEHYPSALLKLEQDTVSMRWAHAQNRMLVTDYAYFPESRPLAVSAGGQKY